LAACAPLGETARAQISEPSTIRDGVFTVEQALRGQAAYTGPCDRCHGYKLDGASDDPDMLPAPPVAGAKFLRKWNGRTLAALVEYLSVAMPANNPGYLRADEWTDIVAYMLSVSGMPAGADKLQPDREALAGIVIVMPGE
jgi:quinoprotein glucose dehydrogenase